MKKTFGAILIGLGVLLIVASSLNARNAPNASHLMGTFLPGLLVLIFGLALGREKTSLTAEGSAGNAQRPGDRGKEVQIRELKTKANLGVLGGIVMMFMGSGFAQRGPELLLVGVAISLAGWALMVWGCVNYIRWKGYSGWYGLFGYLLLPGLLILVCFPNRRNRLLQEQRPEQMAAWEAVAVDDRSSGYRYLLTLAPLGMLFICLAGLQLLFRSNIDAAEWKEVAPPELGFRALMPGTPRLEQKTQETPTGNVELDKFTVEPKGKKELFMIVSVRFPEGVSRQFGTAKLLELGRQDVLSASQGQLKSEQQIVLSGCPGLEMEVLPPKGAIIKVRIYAKQNQFYQVSVHVPQIRLSSEDVQKYFDSFKLSAEPAAARVLDTLMLK